MPKVNPEILAWARETAGLTLEDATKKLRISDLRDSSAICLSSDRMMKYINFFPAV